MYQNFREIESPLSAFNNFQLQISDKLNDVVYGPYSRISKLNQLTVKSELIFNSDSIVIMGFCKLMADRNQMKMQMLKALNSEELEVVAALQKNLMLVETCFFQYIQMYNRIGFGYNDVPNKLLKNIVNMIEQPRYHDILQQSSFLIPFKSKVGSKLENDPNIFMNKLYNRFEYIIKFKQETKTTFSYGIYKVLSSDLNENKSLENIRFYESDLLHKAVVRMDEAEKFVLNLFCYGNLC
jgi:hypothetical protein